MLTKSLKTLCLGLLCAAGLSYAAEQPLDRIVAIVDDGIIMHSQFEKRLQEVRKNISIRNAELPPEDMLRQQVLDRMILDELQLQIGERSGIRIADDELNESIASLAQRNQTTVPDFLNMLRQDGLSEADVREQIRNEIIINRVRQYRVAERVQVTEQEVRNFLNSTLGKMQLAEDYRLANILIPLSDSPSADEIAEVEQKVELVQKRLHEGADFQQLAMSYSASENALEGGDMGWRKAGQLPPPFDTMVSQMSIGDVTEPLRTAGGIIILKLLDKQGTDNSMRDEVHVRHILLKPSEIRSPAATQQLAQRLYERINSGEDFAQLAKQYSEDPGSALQGGDLNWTDPQNLVPAFRSVMANTAIGELSKPFESQFGWHVLQVLDRRITDSSQELREQQALNLIHNRKYEEELQIWLREIRDEAYVEIKEL
ncbi:peptidylprolyl isomerase [Thiopseudomonas acetoxidans]|uniref:Chaperone SurA n=1 Tax=Thiopseudomonas acetoxidans TaxID=3041622 RepID=A0ABT7SQR9_9GAMM|nr:peptidylprolyl isomerase [Thiopseudomonas sp. CY1220]MDM7857864.1 peptidylprolyl isomerase [Thiopseudomonas sp. CY1220]